MWIIRVALSRPYTFFVLAIAILLFGPLAILRTPVDIFPDIRLPVVSVVWTYGGLPPGDISDRITTYFERQTTTVVNDIDHIESQSLPGVAVVKIFFHANVRIDAAIAQVTAISQTVLKLLPPGITPPLVITYNASSVPILQLALSSDKLSEQQLFDLSNNFIRPQLAEVEGAAVPSPYGGKNRLVMVDVDPRALQAKNLSPADVTTAILAQNLVLPAGTAKVGMFEYNVSLNASPTALADLDNLPIRTVNGATLYLRDVAHVRDGYAPQTNLVRVDGRRSVLTTIQKTGAVSTLDIISQVKACSRGSRPARRRSSTGPGGRPVLVRQGRGRRRRPRGRDRRGLTGLMILLFLGSWRSTLIITVSIPLAMLSSIVALSALGETINMMTLGGLALAVGILVDDATVTIENINWHLEQGKDVATAILDGGQQIIIPALFSLLSHLHRVRADVLPRGRGALPVRADGRGGRVRADRLLLLSRTLVPTLAKYLLKRMHTHADTESPRAQRRRAASSRNPLIRFQQGFERRFAVVREGYYAAPDAGDRAPPRCS